MRTRTSGQNAYLVLLIGTVAALLWAIPSLVDLRHSQMGDDYFALGVGLLDTGRWPSVFLPYPILISSLSYLAFGNSGPVSVIALNIVLSGVTAVCTYRVSELLVGSTWGFVSVGLMCLLPSLMGTIGLVSSETPYTAFLWISIWIITVAFTSGQIDLARGMGLGLALGAACWTRATGVFAAVLLLSFAWLVLAGSSRWRVAGALVSLILSIAPLAWWNHAHYGRVFLSVSRPYNVAVLAIGPVWAESKGVPFKASYEMYRNHLPVSRERLYRDPVGMARDMEIFAIDFAKSNPDRVAKRVLVQQFKAWLDPDSESFVQRLGYLRMSRIGGFMRAVHIVILAFAILGGIRLWQNGLRWQFSLVVILSILHIAGTGAAAYGRFLAPMMPALAIGATYWLHSEWIRRHPTIKLP